MSEELHRQLEALLMARYCAGDQRAVECLAEIGAVLLNAAASNRPWEEATHEVIRELLEKPAATLAEFDPAHGPLLNYLKRRTRWKGRDLWLADERRRRREHQAAAERGAAAAAPLTDWPEEAEGLRPGLTPGQWALVLEALQDYLGTRPEGMAGDAGRASTDAGSRPEVPGEATRQPRDDAFRHMLSRIRQKAIEARVAEWEGKK